VNIKNSILIRVQVAFLLVCIFAGAITYKIFHIQMVDGKKWEQMSKDISLQYRKVKATRGNILADDGSLLATSLPFYRLAIDPTRPNADVVSKELDSLCYLLSSYFGENSASYYKRKISNARASGRQYVTLSRELVNYQSRKEMMEWPIFRYGRHRGGVIFEKVDKRFLPFSYLGLRTIGYLNESNQGAGLEYSFNNVLAGTDGETLYQKMAGGNWKPVYDGSGVRPEDGFDLVTTIDVNLQDVSEDALHRALREHDADYGVLVLMEVHTGQIKAMVNLSRNSNGTYGERYNYAVGEHGLQEPGSTFKLATMIALLEETNINLHDSVDTGDGELKFYNNTVRDHHEGGFGMMSVQDAFEQSSNIAMAKLADQYFGLKHEDFYQYLEQLQLTKPVGFQIVGEGNPKIKKPADWSGITLPWMAYGYGLEMTPLQTLNLFNAVANDGKLIRPMIVKSINQVDRPVQEFETEVLNKKICSEETLSKLKTMLEGVVERGTAQNINNAHYKIAGKTGTAQLLRNGRYTRNYRTSFAGYFPADAPEYSCIVVIENPKGYRQYGSSVAAPVFKELADKIYARNIDMHDEIAQEVSPPVGIFPVIRSGKREDLVYLCNEFGISNHSETEESWVRTSVSNNSIDWKANNVKQGVVPDVKGMTLRDALYVLENTGLRVDFKGHGRVIQQSLLPGYKFQKGKNITIKLG